MSYLKPKELAAKLRVSVDTVRRWARQNVVPAVRPTPRTLLFDEAAVEEALRRRSAGGPELPHASPTGTVGDAAEGGGKTATAG